MKFDRLKEKYEVNIDNEIIIFIHDDFIIRVINEKIVYINDLFYKKYRNLTEDKLLDLINNNVFIQYYDRLFGAFKIYKKKVFDKKRYFNYSKVNMVFNDTKVLYRTVFQDLNINEIIELAIQEPIRYNYVKIIYSNDKKQRMIIYETNIGSYSYVIENLYICDEYERSWSQQYAWYEGVSAGGFYESVDLIINELKYILDWSFEDDL